MAQLNASAAWLRLRWELARARQQPRVALGVLLAATALAVAAAALALYAQRQAAAGAVQRQAALKAAAAIAAQPTAAVQRRAALDAFYGLLPPAEDAAAVVQTLLELAERNDLKLVRGSYRLEPENAAPFARYRIGLPLSGPPAHIQQFVQQALVAQPALAIENIQFKRSGAGAATLEARLQCVIYVRTGSTPAAAAPLPAPAPQPAGMAL